MPYSSLCCAYNPKGPKPLVDSWHGAAFACTTSNNNIIISSKGSPAVEKYLAGAMLFLAHVDLSKETCISNKIKKIRKLIAYSQSRSLCE